MRRRVEILAPAGSIESLRAAVCAGADAVYIGGTRFGARAYAKNLSEEELLEAIDYVHIHGRRIYLTVNTLLKDSEIDQLYEYLLPYYLRGADGVIVQDLGVIGYLRRYFPDLAVHASTQMTVTGADGAALLKEKGITRVVPARELSLSEIRKMKEQTGLEIECFVHGALCYCYSGQCLLSSMIGGRSGNRGQCAQPCRLPYRADGGKAADLLSLKDLCTIEMLPELIGAGIDSFKIEGRMKQPDYVYTVVQMYRKYADICLESGACSRGKYTVTKEDKEALLSAYQRRGYTDGYYMRYNGKDMISWQRPAALKEEEQVQDYKLQEKINGKLILSPGSRAKLLLSCGECRAECEGETVQQALKQPLEAARVKKQMCKTGNTQFTFDKLEVQIEGQAFLTMQALNELRRNGTRKLAECILERYQRSERRILDLSECDGIADRPLESGSGGVRVQPDGAYREGQPETAYSVQTLEQLEEAYSCGYADVIYVDDLPGTGDLLLRIPRLKEERPGCRIYLAMPYIFRAKAAGDWEGFYEKLVSVYDGVLIRNLESYRWLKQHGYAKEIRSDHNLYVFNRYGKTFMRELGISRFTAPLELNARELGRLDIRGAVLSVYGYQPVMITANCIWKTTDQCLKTELSGGRQDSQYLCISDRYKKRFAVRRCCRYCYNVIYNSAPLFLADQAEEIRRLAPGEIRLDFTAETREEVRGVAKLYADAFIRRKALTPPEREYTRGHFKRGVK